jgi:hypothetical protein
MATLLSLSQRAEELRVKKVNSAIVGYEWERRRRRKLV